MALPPSAPRQTRVLRYDAVRWEPLEHRADVTLGHRPGFSLTEIRAIVPQLAQGALGRTDIEQHLQTKMAQIDAHIQQLQTLKTELAATFASLRCTPTQPIGTDAATAPDSGSGAGAAVARKAFAKQKKK